MVVSSKLAEGEKPTNIAWWDGKKSSFSTFKKDIIAFISKPDDDIQFITDVGKSFVISSCLSKLIAKRQEQDFLRISETTRRLSGLLTLEQEREAV